MERLILFISFAFLSVVPVLAQQNLSLLNTFYRDRYFMHNGQSAGNSLFPYAESDFDLNKKMADSSKQYYDLTEILFKKHLFEAKGENYFITISPVADLSMGKDLSDTNDRRIFQNTRGIIAEVDLMKNFSFSTAFYENQGRYTNYETAQYSALGELYPNVGAGVYNTQNAVIPGAARTKPFKTDGFDYAYATGNMVYKPIKNLSLIAGNTAHFIGDGYRSILLSDNSLSAPFFRIDYKITEKFEFSYIRKRLLNLMRKPASSSAEAYYEPKAFSVNYLTFKPIENFAISLFEGAVWSKGDSLSSYRANPLIYSPIPVINNFILNDSVVSTITGLNVSLIVKQNNRFYGQLALTNMESDKMAFQLGYRGFNCGKLKDFMVQLEYNNVSKGMYSSSYKRLNYVNGNLPMAHVKGNGFQEFIFRINYEYKRAYLDLKSIYYVLKDYNSTGLLPVAKPTVLQNANLFLQSVEMGYRFNRKMNLCVFMNWQYRSASDGISLNTNLFQFGLRTGIINRYSDF